MPHAEKQPLPKVWEDVTPAWLSEVLEQEVTSINITKKVLEATASKLFITITYADPEAAQRAHKPRKVCLKGGFNPQLMKHHPSLAAHYKRECEFFQLIEPKLEQNTLLKCHWAGSDKYQGIVILEDIGVPELGVTFGDPKVTLTVDQVRDGVEQLAILHGNTWGATSEKYPWLTNNYDAAVLRLASKWDDIRKAEDRPPLPEHWNGDRVTAVLEKIYDIRNKDTTTPHCILHGDAHVANIYRKKNGSPEFFDWQLLHIGSPLNDYTYFTVGALSIADRKAHEMDILKHYLASLAKHGGPSLTLEDVIDEYRKYTLAGMVWVLVPYTMQPKENVVPMTERYVSAIEDHKAIELVESL